MDRPRAARAPAALAGPEPRGGLLVFAAALPPRLADAQALPALGLAGTPPLHPEAGVDALLAARGDTVDAPALVLLVVAELAQPLALARRLHRAWPLACIIFHCEAADVAHWRLAIGPGAGLGRHWCVLDADDPRWPARVHDALANARRRLRSRTTLDRANARIAAAPPPVNAGEYQRLRASTQHLANFLRHSQDAVFGVDAAGSILFWNRGAEVLLGLPAADAIGRAVAGLPGYGAALHAALDGLDPGAPTSMIEHALPAGDGSARTLEFAVSAIDAAGMGGATVFVHDITDRHAEEARLREANQTLESLVSTRTRELQSSQQALLQAQKLESIGQLTGGVAHDFNNVLQIIGSNLQLLVAQGGLPAGAGEYARTALRAVDRGALLTAQLLAFARRQPLNPAPLNLNRMMRDLDGMLRRSLGEEVQVETSLAGGLWTTFADAAQLENVILNLAINARDAMPDGGRLTIETANATLDEAYTDPLGDVSPGQYVMLAVSDTGTGMPPDVVAQAFEPFFTTKPEGKGTGLGLSMAYGFAKQSSGHIRIYSEPGSGTTVRLYLPRSHADEVRQLVPPAGPVAGGSETVLVVEDDQEVQAGAVNMLSGLGYRVLRADDAQAALTILRSGVAVDLLFTDVVMPGPVRSPELVRQARELLPGIAVLYTSGYTQNAIVHGGRLDPGVELLSKPYLREDLARRARRLLDARKRPAAASPTAATRPGTTGTARILFVEDEMDARTTTQMLLEMLGHRVVAAGDARTALAALAAQPFDILLTDVSLGRDCGIALAREAVARSPALKVVFASGHARLTGIPEGLRCWTLVKPYASELEAMLAQVLEA